MQAPVPVTVPPQIPASIPDSVRWKLFRAQEHLEELGAETRRFFQKNPAKVVREENTNPDEFVGKVVCSTSIPPRIPCIVGDFLQNLRSSLDYLVWELVLAAKNDPARDNMFPICTTPEAFKQQLGRRRLNGVPVDAITEIEALQPYHSGKDASVNVLAMMDEFCNINKHRRVLTTIMYGGQAPDDFITQEIDGQLYGSLNFYSMLQQGTKIGPFPIVDGPFGRGPKVDVPPNIVAFVAFNEGTTQNVEVGFTLSIFGGYIVQELSRFERFFT